MRTIARWTSVALHPFLLLPIAVALATQRAALAERATVLGIVTGCLALLAVFVLREWRRGAVRDVDFSEQAKRPRLYAVAMAATGGASLALHFTHQSPAAVRATAVACAMLAVGLLVNLRWKVSLHVAFAVYAAAIVWALGPLAVACGVLLAALVAWSRVAYGRHTRGEVLLGVLLGALAGAAYVLLTRAAR